MRTDIPVRILGVDPGSRVTGFGVVEVSGTRLQHIVSGAIRVGNDALGARLRRIFEELSGVIADYAPAEFAIEKVFVQRNVESALKLGQARGVAICAAALHNLPVNEYAPNQIKLAVVGQGHAAKEQVQHMIRVLLKLPEAPVADAADALACAICHGHLRRSLQWTRKGLAMRNVAS